MGNPNISSLVPNLKRRTGNAGLNDDQLLPNALLARFGFPDPSDVTDDDEAAHALALPSSGEQKNNAGAITESKNISELKLNGAMKSSAQIQDKTDGKSNELGAKNHPSCGQQIHAKNGKSSRNSSMGSSCSPSSERNADIRINKNEKEMTAAQKGSPNRFKAKVCDDEADNVKLLNSKQSKCSSSFETKTHKGKTYTKVKSDCPSKAACSNFDSLSSSDDDSDANLSKKPNTGSPYNSGELRKTPDRTVKIDMEQEDELSEGSSTSFSPEISLLGLKSSLSGVSSGPSKPIAVSNLKQAREVGTQTSLSSGLNEIEFVENDRTKFSTPTQTSHHSISGMTKSGNVYHDMPGIVCHFPQDKEVKLSTSKSHEAAKLKNSIELVSHSSVT